MITQEQVNFLVDLAKECELTDPIDWGKLALTEDQAYQMMASGLLEQFSEISDKDFRMVILATTTKLLVENFVLNLRLKSGANILKGV